MFSTIGLCSVGVSVSSQADTALRQQIFFTKSVQSAMLFIKPLIEHLPIMSDAAAFTLNFQRRHELHDVCGIVFIDGKAALVNQQHLFAMGKEPHGGVAHRDFPEMRFAAAQPVDEAACAPRR